MNLQSRAGAEKSAAPLQMRKPSGFTISQINLLRVLAMFGIFFHHLWKGIPNTSEAGLIGQIFSFAFGMGDRGVIFFNIISGFVLALPYLGFEKRPFPGYAQFLRRRFLRILPPYYLALLLFTACNTLILKETLGSFLGSFFEHAIFIQSFQYGSFATNIAAYWYLSLLTQFYLLFPFILRFFIFLGARKAFLCIGVLCWGGCQLLALYVFARPESILGMTDFLIYFNLPARLPEFALGMWLASSWNPALAPSRRLPFGPFFVLGIYGAALFAACGTLFSDRLTLPLSLVRDVAWCFIVIVVFFVNKTVGRIGISRVFMNVAAASYSIYLVHQPLLSYGAMLLGGRFGPLGQFAFLTIVFGPACYLLARVLDALTVRIMAPITGRGK